jgi:TIR domain
VPTGAVNARHRRPVAAAPLAFSAFLSHRYRSPAVNSFFFRMFAEEAHIQFSVDRGSFATNVTRLERLMRDADAFVGLYPFPGGGLERPRRPELEKESRYFRLELDLAERSRKPSIVFIDSRYGDVIDPPGSFIQCRFDWQQVVGEAPVPRASLFREQFRAFCRLVRISLEELAAETRHAQSMTSVGVLLPRHPAEPSGFTEKQIDVVANVIAETGAKLVVMPWPPRLDMAFAQTLETLDWVVVDVGDAAAATGIAAYLHGRFVPSLRLLRTTGPGSPAKTSQLIEALYGAHDVGYRKDIVEWHDEASLQAGVRVRVENLMAERLRIADRLEAERYFNSAALRKEAVFVSYSGRDHAVAAPLIAALKARFQQVFDYRDKAESIPPGTSWIETLFERLAAAPIGIALLSPDYFQSGNCVHEGQEMIALRDAKRMTLFPIKLYAGDLVSPPWLTALQYLRYWDYADATTAVDTIVAQFPAT